MNFPLAAIWMLNLNHEVIGSRQETSRLLGHSGVILINGITEYLL